MSFEVFKLESVLNSAVKALGYVEPTPIQAEAIPQILAGRDVMGLAQTGTGKTAAFVLPVLQRLLGRKWGRVRALVIAPTRELAEQINDSIRQLARGTKIRSTTIYGGVGEGRQIQELKAGVEIVVACPGRLIDFMRRKLVDFSALEFLVLDEADQMFDMGFFPDIRRILGLLPRDRQTLMFSATMPQDIRALAEEALHRPVTLRVNRDAPAETVSHALYPVKDDQKTPVLLTLLKNTDTESVLIFTRTKHRAKKLGLTLTNAGYRATCLQGNLSQSRRQEALKGFKDGVYQIMVATDIAARGIDVSNISHVINYDMPTTTEAYTHRIGRTGRAAKTGDAFTLVLKEDEPMVRAIERVLGARIERRIATGSSAIVEALSSERPGTGRKPAASRSSWGRSGRSFNRRGRSQPRQRSYQQTH